MSKYTIYIGYTNWLQHSFQPNTLLKDVRKALGSSITNNHRFLNYQDTSVNYTDMIVSLSDENFLPISAITGLLNQVYLTNITATINTDMLGFRTPWFWDRKLGVQIGFNTEQSARNSNKGKMPPLMLTNVKLANPDIRGMGAMKNVLVCEKNTVIQFLLNSPGSMAYGYDIRPVSGTPITQNPLYICFKSCNSGNRSTGLLRKYYTPNSSSDGKMIQIVPTTSVKLSNRTTLSYMKFTVKSWNVTSYTEKNGTTHTCNKIPSKLLRSSKVSPGTSTPHTKASGQVFNGPIHHVVQNTSPTGIFGEVVFYAFVFDTHADAMKAFTAINTPDQSLWVV
ncbi:hypothetical protein TOREUM_20798 [Tenacibaculum litoreum]|uniref:hypothetical protein n=1 Tax=Tenacibaculum litoreum TaxID=321269 RepID=UPI003895C27D